MSEETFTIPEGFFDDPVVFDPYKLPPLMVITECDVYETLNFCTSYAQRKHIAACIILGQPFNRKRKEPTT